MDKGSEEVGSTKMIGSMRRWIQEENNGSPGPSSQQFPMCAEEKMNTQLFNRIVIGVMPWRGLEVFLPIQVIMHLSPTLLLSSWWDFIGTSRSPCCFHLIFYTNQINVLINPFIGLIMPPLGLKLYMLSFSLKAHISTAPSTSSWHSNLCLVCVVRLECTLLEGRVNISFSFLSSSLELSFYL